MNQSSATMLHYYVILGFVAVCFTKQLPPYIKPCRRDDPKFDVCVKKHAIEAIPSIVKGDKEYKIPVLDPFHIKEITLDTGDQLSVKLNNLELRGIADIELKDIKLDLENRHFQYKVYLKKITIDGQYEIDGRILIVPIKGSGPVHLKCENMVVDYEFFYNFMKKDGKEYFDPDVKSNISYTLDKVNLKLDNLFNGNKELGDRTNEFLNENILELNKDFTPTFVKAMDAVILLVIKATFPLVPYDEVFP